MPGLVGIASKTELNAKLLDQMINSLKHEDFFQVDKFINLNIGISRIHKKIFNPEQQPIFNEDKSLCIFMDGKIYDYQDDLNKLKLQGYKFNLKNDPEFCLQSYIAHGINFIKKLNGSFVFVICDLQNNKIILVNDRFGLRPIFYTIKNGKFLFGSEAKTILEDKEFKKELNFEAISDFFAFRDILGNKTFFKGIEILPPASIAVWDGALSINQYWDLNYQPDYMKSEEYFVDELVKAFKKAVKIRMQDNLRYGVSLSGGLDSRAVVAAIPEEKRRDVVSFTYGINGCDEAKIAEKVANKARIKHIFLKNNEKLLIDYAEKCLYITEGRNNIGVSYGIPMHKAVQPLIDVMFDGFAMDLTLGGGYLNRKVIDCKNEEDLIKLIFDKYLFFSEKEFSKLFDRNYISKLKNKYRKSYLKTFKDIKATHPGNKSDYFFIKSHVSYIPIFYSMVRNFIETSYPTTDNNLIDIILKIPPKLRFNHRIYRKFFMKLSPDLARIPYNKTMLGANIPLLFWGIAQKYLDGKEQIKRKIWKFSKGKIHLSNKRSYVNFEEWFRLNKNWKAFFAKLLLNEDYNLKQIFNQKYINKLFQEQITGEKDTSKKLIHIASFKLFLKLFFMRTKSYSN